MEQLYRMTRRTLLREERGAVAAEFAILSPFIILILFGMILMGHMLYLHSNMLTAARDAVRRLAAAEISAAQAETVALNWLSDWNVTDVQFSANASVPVNPGETDAVVTVTAPLSQATLGLDIFGHFGAGTLTAEATMRYEN